MINITTKLNREDYIKMAYHLFYRNGAIKGLTGIGVFFIFLSLATLVSEDKFSWFLLIFGLVITVGLRVQIYFSAKGNYKADARVRESIDYQFDNEEIKITGESFNSRLTWDKIYSVTENKDWVIIWQTRQITNVLRKKDFKGDDLTSFKKIVNAQTGLKNKLK